MLAAALAALVCLVAGAVFFAGHKPRFITPEKAGFSEPAQVTLTAANGLSALAPANSSPAFALAGQNGYKGVQFEARRTADGIWVVMQEEKINGATNRRGKVSEMTYKQLLQCRIDKGHGKKQYQKKDELTVQTLEQALSICIKYGMTPVIEVKQSGADCVEELFRAVDGGWETEYVFVFAEEEQLSKAQELLAGKTLKLEKENVLLCRFTEKLNAKTLAQAKETPEIAVYFPAKENKKIKKVQKFTDAGLTLYACGVNKKKQAKALYNAGVRRFTTDKLAYQEITAEEERTAANSKRPTTSPAKADESSSRTRKRPNASARPESSSRTKKPSTTAKKTQNAQ